MRQGSIVGLHISTEHGKPMQSVPQARAISDLGLEGDRHAKAGSARQILIMDTETLDSVSLKPADVRENITTAGLDLRNVPPGNVFFIGDGVTLEVTGDCEACRRMDQIRPGIRKALKDRRGILTMVVNGGEIKVGDTIRLEP